jgi:predicted RNA-binding Zn-ribbon protein involved in translation (DUF1610 family)
MKVLFFDLETTPLLGWTWRAYEDNLLEIQKDSELLALGWWVAGDAPEVVSRRTKSERQMVRILWQLFDSADVVVAQNGDRFDIKVANTLFQRYGLNPPSPYKTVDTLKLAKKYFRFPKNNLDYLGKILVGETKHVTESGLWFACMEGDQRALRKMERYCLQDVKLLKKVYDKLKSFHTGHPNYNVYNETTHRCPVCGGKTQRRGFMVTRVGKYQRYQCMECGAWSKGERIKSDKVIS